MITRGFNLVMALFFIAIGIPITATGVHGHSAMVVILGLVAIVYGLYGLCRYVFFRTKMTVSPNKPQPVDALVALAISIGLLVLLGQWWGAWVLLLVPVMATWVGNVALGGRLNESSLDVYTRCERWYRSRNDQTRGSSQ